MTGLTKDQAQQICKEVCSECGKGSDPRRRDDTGEYIHEFVNGVAYSHRLCLATNFRNLHRDLLNG